MADPARQLEDALAVGGGVVPRLRASLVDVSQAESERRPDPAGWSVGEVAHHLILVFRRAAARCPEIVATEPPDRFEYAAVVAKRTWTLPDIADIEKGGRGVAPEAVRPTPGGAIRTLADELGAAWDELQAALRPLRGRDLSRYYYEHGRLGPLNLYEFIAFQGYHALKHLKQIERTLAQVRGSDSPRPPRPQATPRGEQR